MTTFERVKRGSLLGVSWKSSVQDYSGEGGAIGYTMSDRTLDVYLPGKITVTCKRYVDAAPGSPNGTQAYRDATLTIRTPGWLHRAGLWHGYSRRRVADLSTVGLSGRRKWSWPRVMWGPYGDDDE